MRFICDECVSASLVSALQQADCDVVDIGVEDSGASATATYCDGRCARDA